MGSVLDSQSGPDDSVFLTPIYVKLRGPHAFVVRYGQINGQAYSEYLRADGEWVRLEPLAKLDEEMCMLPIDREFPVL